MRRALTTLAATAVLVQGVAPAPAQAQPAQSGPATTTRVDDNQAAISYDTGWTEQRNGAAYGGTLRFASQTGAGASLTFTGVSVRVVTKKGPSAGILDVYVDDTLVRSFDTWAPDHQYGVVAYETADLPLGQHTVAVRNSGRANMSSNGHFVHLDYIDTTDRPGAQAYADLGFGLFVHYGINTYTGTAGAQGDPAAHPSTEFAPTDFDADQWAAAAEAAGMRYLVYTTKHHYGWSGWPTAVGSDPRYDITTTDEPFQDMDTVRSVVDAARAHNLVPIVYYSAWDRTNFVIDGNNRNPEYTQFMKSQLTELLGGDYGDIPVLWVDIANHLSDDQLGEISAHAHTLRPGIVLVLNSPSPGPAHADILNYESAEQPGAGANRPATTDRSTTIGEDVLGCDGGAVAGWWSFDNRFDPACKAWTRDKTLGMRDLLNERNSTLGLNVPPGPNGRLSPKAEGFLRALGPTDDRDAAITYSDGWAPRNERGAYRNSLTYSAASGATARYTFTGTSVTVETRLGPGSGIMNVYLDGTKVSTFDTWSPTIVHHATAFKTGDLASGPHAITIEATGDRNPSAHAASVHLDSIQHYDG